MITLLGINPERSRKQPELAGNRAATVCLIVRAASSVFAMFVGQRIRKSVEEHCFKVYDEEIHITMSIGLATYSTKITEGTQIMECADSALYQAKRQGKNRVCVFV